MSDIQVPTGQTPPKKKKAAESFSPPIQRSLQDAATLLGKPSPASSKRDSQVYMEPELKQRLHTLALQRQMSLKALMEHIALAYLAVEEGK